MNLSQIITFAIISVVGPQIILALLLVLTERKYMSTLFYIIGSALGVVIMVALQVFILPKFEGLRIVSNIVNVAKYAVVAFFIYNCYETYKNRNSKKTPEIFELTKSGSFKVLVLTGMLLFSLFPTDFLVTIELSKQILEKNQSFYTTVAPVVMMNAVLLSVPIFIYSLFSKQFERVMPKVNAFIGRYAWIITVVINIVIILSLIK